MTRQFSAGGIVHKEPDLWLIRKPKANEGFKGSLEWSFPKGLIEEGETTEVAALRETAEEAGVEAKIVKKLPAIKIFFTDQSGDKIMKFITYFVMEYVREIPGGFGWETEEVRWVSKDEALELLAFSSEKKLLINGT